MANLEVSTPFNFSPRSGRLGQTNEMFHQGYAGLVEAMRQRLGTRELPVILMYGDTLVLLHDGHREAVVVFPELYHNLKAISHLPFTVYAVLVTNGPGVLSENTLSLLKQHQELAESLLESAISETYLAHCVDKSQQLLVSTIRFISERLQASEHGQPTLDSYAREIAPLLLDNAAEAAQLGLDCLHKQINQWQVQVGEEHWQNLHVVICSGHQARYRETSKQYFQRLLREPESHAAEQERRVIYAESAGDEAKALKLLAVHLVDQQAAEAFFNCATRLQQDVLADATAAYLEQLLPID
jgi:hypothetical protein